MTTTIYVRLLTDLFIELRIRIVLRSTWDCNARRKGVACSLVEAPIR